jgi:hypothetical protein
MKKLLLVSIFFTLAIIVPMPIMAGVDINAGISLPPPIVFEAHPEVIVMPDTSGVYLVADVDADKPQGDQTGRDEKQQEPSLEKGKTAGSEEKSKLRINVWPVKPTDNIKSLPETWGPKHTPPDRPD